ncbi:hypothetical protein C9374_013350 [Naegleria lovaniensis]|uniref:Phospholipid/glycerol acyltransferase domain-containing protein n=1 Tax=Naegleria lovaniensis TaxID=51637 RepID=A0AA88GVS2_NAELO|nr:uncharacterized protein C9374_013350 [Naegleria lovaniensis]KAG2391865.1 hypothetical protein C9374_013350 [Naegleria lovaniensis]
MQNNNNMKAIYSLAQFIRFCTLVFAICFYCGIMTIGLILLTPLKYFGFGDLVFKIYCMWAGRGYWTFIFVLEQLDQVELIWYGDKIPKYENSICISNHVADTDFILIQTFGMRKGMLGHTKFMMKEIIKYVPGVGWGCYLLNHIMMTRNWTKDKDSIAKVFGNIKSHKIPVWIISFLEGTRFTPQKLEACKKFCEKKGIKPTEYVLTPRVKGFKATVSNFADSHIEYVYDFTIAYEDGPVSIMQLMRKPFKGKRIHIHVRRIPIKDIPYDDDEKIEKWVYDCFYRKDEMLKEFQKTKSFGEALHEPYNYEDFITEPLKRMSKL